MVNELKKELSKLSGVDFFNPKFRDVFKKYFPNDNSENEINSNEEDRLKEVIGEEENTQDALTPETEKEETKAEDVKEDPVKEEGEDPKPTEEPVEEEKPTEEEPKPDVDDNPVEEPKEEPAEEPKVEVPTEDAGEPKDTSNTELLEVRLELELIKAGIRPDRLASAKKLFMQEIHSIDDLAKVPDLVAQYPEWNKQEGEEAKPFGMSLDDNGDGLTAEERRLREMGIDPKA